MKTESMSVKVQLLRLQGEEALGGSLPSPAPSHEALWLPMQGFLGL